MSQSLDRGIALVSDLTDTESMDRRRERGEEDLVLCALLALNQTSLYPEEHLFGLELIQETCEERREDEPRLTRASLRRTLKRLHNQGLVRNNVEDPARMPEEIDWVRLSDPVVAKTRVDGGEPNFIEDGSRLRNSLLAE